MEMLTQPAHCAGYCRYISGHGRIALLPGRSVVGIDSSQDDTTDPTVACVKIDYRVDVASYAQRIDASIYRRVEMDTIIRARVTDSVDIPANQRSTLYLTAAAKIAGHHKTIVVKDGRLGCRIRAEQGWRAQTQRN